MKPRAAERKRWASLNAGSKPVRVVAKHLLAFGAIYRGGNFEDLGSHGSDELGFSNQRNDSGRTDSGIR